jgi:dTMP kinase
LALFIVFEGGDGSGKTTQAGLLFNRLCREKRSIKLLAEPGGTALGDYVRDLFVLPREVRVGRGLKYILTSAGKGPQIPFDVLVHMTPETELFLFSAARAQLVSEEITPSLQKGISVICVRYVYSTLAYQGFGREMDLDFVRRVCRVATGDLLPDMVFLLDIDPAQALRRKGGSEEASRFEAEELGFHQRIREGYLQLAQEDPGRWTILDASRQKRKIAEEVYSAVMAKMREGPESPRKKTGPQASQKWPTEKML